MFTGIVEEVGRITALTRRHPAARLTIAAERVCGDMQVGDSMAIDGVCLTVVEHSSSGFAVDVQQETLQRTTIGAYKPGGHVNLERAVQPHTRMGGHYVQGHVDGLGSITAWRQEGADWVLRLRVPGELQRYIVEKGFICVNGMSLTVVERGPQVAVHVVPHTRAVTALQYVVVGERVNIEVDVFAKYVESLMR
jgi:riboflavin synthase